jgi:hypothetical protein
LFAGNIDLILEYLKTKATKDFLIGATVEALAYIATYSLIYGDDWVNEIPWKDFWIDVMVAGCQQSLGLSRIDQAILSCFRAMDIEKLYDIIVHFSSKNSDEISGSITIAAISCTISGVIEYVLRGSLKDNVLKALNASPGRLAYLLTKLNILPEMKLVILKQFWGIKELFKTKSAAFLNDLDNFILKTNKGVQAFAILMKRQMNDIGLISKANIKRLSQIIEKNELSDQLTKLLQETVDLNRFIKELHTCETVDKYLMLKKAIADASNTITLPTGGARITVSKFMDDYYSDLANSYYKATANTQHYVRVYENTSEAIEVMIEIKNKAIDISIRVFTEELKNYIREENEENEN